MAAAPPPFRRPTTLAAALSELVDLQPSRLLAGGTDLMVELQTGRATPQRIVDLSRVTELRGIRCGGDGTWIGAATTCSDLLACAELGQRVPLLRAVASEFAAPQIRNRATIGGNLATASPAGDLAPALFALGATVRLRSQRGPRDLAMAQFFTGYRQHAGAADELIEGVFVPPRPDGERSAFHKVGTRAAQAIAKVALAVTIVVRGGVVEQIAAGVGAVRDRPAPLPSLGALVGIVPDAAAIAAVARAAATVDIAPIDDVRSTAHYRRHALQRLLVAALGTLVGEA